MWLLKTADLVTYTEEILNWKLHFLGSVTRLSCSFREPNIQLPQWRLQALNFKIEKRFKVNDKKELGREPQPVFKSQYLMERNNYQRTSLFAETEVLRVIFRKKCSIQSCLKPF